MKHFLNLTTATLFLALVVFISCGGGSDEPDAPVDPCDEKTTFLIGQATVSSVTNPNSQNVTTDWTGFTVTFAGTKDGGGYTTTVSSLADGSLANIWAPSGGWTFGDTNCNTVNITATGLTDRSASLSVSATAMTLSFNVPEADTGRTFGIPGNWTFEFTLN